MRSPEPVPDNSPPRVAHRAHVRIGTAGWSIPGPHTASFPAGATHLERYASIFSCAEINSSFYRPHQPSTYARWAASTPQNFRFSVKVPKAITHQSSLTPTPAEFHAFLDQAGNLGEKLGPIQFQFPPRQHFEEAGLRNFFSLFREVYPHGPAAVEPRHATWFSPEADRLLDSFSMARVIADPPVVPEATHPGDHARLVYYCLHGSPRVYYSSYAAAWLKNLAATFSTYSPTSDIWSIFDNTASGAATENALHLMRNISADL